MIHYPVTEKYNIAVENKIKVEIFELKTILRKLNM